MSRLFARRLSIYNFAWGLLKTTKKVNYVPQKMKKNPNIYIGSIWRSLQAQPKIIKKLSKTQINQSKQKKILIKICLVPQK
jgi:hypothetical protein